MLRQGVGLGPKRKGATGEVVALPIQRYALRKMSRKMLL